MILIILMVLGIGLLCTFMAIGDLQLQVDKLKKKISRLEKVKQK